MIMCVLLCYPVSIRIYYQQGGLFLVLLVFLHVANFRYVANFRFLTLYIFDFIDIVLYFLGWPHSSCGDEVP